jgi:hypothetical protein
MKHPPETADALDRRAFLARGGGLALAPLLGAGRERLRNHAPRAKRLIFLFQSGGPSQLDLLDYKPLLNERHGQELPDSVRAGQRLTTMSSNQSTFPLAGSVFRFAQHGECGAWVSELLPHTAAIVDRLCIIRSLYTEAINHDPAITFFQTGSQRAGRPSLGAWLSWALGSENGDLPAFCVLITRDKGGQPLYARLWGSGFLPSAHQGVQLRAGADPVLFLSDPPGVSRAARERMLARLAELHRLQHERIGDPDIEARIARYELAFRMQASVPQLMDLRDESEATLALYGPEVRTPGTFAANCLLARRLAERGVRCIQLYHKDWDHHGGLPAAIRVQSRETDQPAAALVVDLARRGLLDETIVLWGGEFGRTSYSQGKLTAADYGRDHHPRCFSMWVAGGGFRAGATWGATDEFGYNIVEDPVHVHDLQATLLHQLGFDHERLTYEHQGRRYRLTDVHGSVVRGLLA